MELIKFEHNDKFKITAQNWILQFYCSINCLAMCQSFTSWSNNDYEIFIF